MPSLDRNKIRLRELTELWKQLSKNISLYRSSHIIETRAEEKGRYEHLIEQSESDRNDIEKRMERLENKIREEERKEKIQEILDKTYERERAGAISYALAILRDAVDNGFDTQLIQSEIDRLEKKSLVVEEASFLLKRIYLKEFRSDIKSVFTEVVSKLQVSKNEGVEDDSFVPLIKQYVEGEIKPGDFLEHWEGFQGQIRNSQPANVDFRSLAGRLKRGELVLFLGSDIPNLYVPDQWQLNHIISELASAANLTDFKGSLSTVSEYYQMRTDYGLSSLLEKLYPLLPHPRYVITGDTIENLKEHLPVTIIKDLKTISNWTFQSQEQFIETLKENTGQVPAEHHMDLIIESALSNDIPLYRLLSKINTPLVLIVTGYDTLLESAFRKAGKKFAVISSFMRNKRTQDQKENYRVSKLLVKYSDNDVRDVFDLEENLSQLNLLREGYSVIYKIRGILNPDTDDEYQEASQTLILCEKSYLEFARYNEQLIPSYISNLLLDRSLLFMGFLPKQWEDRLIANAILERHQKNTNHSPSQTVRSTMDPFERAYWEKWNVSTYQFNLPDFVNRLEENFE